MKSNWLSYWSKRAELTSEIAATGRGIAEEQFEAIVEEVKMLLEINTGGRVIEIGCVRNRKGKLGENMLFGKCWEFTYL